MQNWLARTIVVLLALAAVIGAGYRLLLIERQVNVTREDEVAFDAQTDALATAVVELRAAQQAYVAQGQGGAFWTARVTSGLAVTPNGASQLTV